MCSYRVPSLQADAPLSAGRAHLLLQVLHPGPVRLIDQFILKLNFKTIPLVFCQACDQFEVPLRDLRLHNHCAPLSAGLK